MDKDTINHIINESVIKKDYDKDRRIRPSHTTSRITIIYIVIGGLWILLSDRILSILVRNEEIYREFQLYKGWFYVFATGAIFYFIIYRAFLLYRKTLDSLVSSYEELNAIYEEIVAMNEELDRQRAELGVSEERYRLVTEGVSDGIWDWDVVNDVYYVSDKWKQDFDYEIQEIGSTIFAWEQLYYPGDWDKCKKELEAYFEQRTGIYESVYRIRNKANEYRWILSRGKGVWDQDERPIRMAGSHTDITEKKEMEEKLEKLAYFDSLTLLPNRACFEKEFAEKYAKRQRICIVNVNVDDMKHINDLYGQEAGDEYLQYISRLMSEVFSEPDMVAHISGDQFAIFHVIEQEGDIVPKLDLLMQNIRRPWKTNGDFLHVSASMGVAVYPEDGAEYSTLMHNAEIAMFHKKENKKDGYVFFERKMYEDTMKISQMNAQLKNAIAAKEFLLYYQPQYDLKSGRVSGLEALIRWNHPKDGFIPPMEFIPIAEKAGSIIPITIWVLQTALQTKRKWEQDGLLSVKVAVNLSGHVLVNEAIVDQICEILENMEIRPGELEIEVTETAVMLDLDKAKRNLLKLRSYGVTIAMDDFGTGYSSLTYLHSLPLDILKMDREFVSNIENKDEDSLICKTVIDLAHNLNLEVVAEGIETAGQKEFLIANECDVGQGYYFSKPVPEDALYHLISK